MELVFGFNLSSTGFQVHSAPARGARKGPDVHGGHRQVPGEAEEEEAEGAGDANRHHFSVALVAVMCCIAVLNTKSFTNSFLHEILPLW